LQLPKNRRIEGGWRGSATVWLGKMVKKTHGGQDGPEGSDGCMSSQKKTNKKFRGKAMNKGKE